MNDKDPSFVEILIYLVVILSALTGVVFLGRFCFVVMGVEVQ